MAIPIHKLCVMLLLSGIAFSSVAAEPAPPQRERVALVIGNVSYRNAPLRNPVNDARAVAEKLKQLGFRVLLRENVSREAMYQSVAEFGTMLKPGGVALFYYAGHGMQIKGRNFLIPVDGDIQSEDDIEFRGIDANQVLARMDSAHSSVNLIVLDACRNNPFRTRNRALSPGLAQMDAPRGTLIAFSTSPGGLAKDGDGPNSIYTRNFVRALSVPGIPVEEVFKQVRIAVDKETGHEQIPWESTSLMGDFYFQPPASAPMPVQSAEAVPAPNREPQTPDRTALPPAGTQRAQESTAGTGSKPKGTRLAAVPDRDYNREGYEIEIKAKSLTADQLPELERKAEAGDVVAQTTLGWAYFLGRGQIDGRNIPRSNPKMLRWTEAAAKQGYPVAQNNLGAIYMEGIGVKMDFHKAQHYFKLAGDQGYVAAQRNLFQVNALLTGKPDIEVLESMSKNVQQQMQRPAP